MNARTVFLLAGFSLAMVLLATSFIVSFRVLSLHSSLGAKCILEIFLIMCLILEERLNKISKAISLSSNITPVMELELKNAKHDLEFYLDWHTKGERNTKYFHTVVNNRRNRNNIRSSMDQDGNWVDDQDSLLQMTYSHFLNIYQSLESENIPDLICYLDDVPLRTLSQSDILDIMKPTSDGEIKMAVFGLPYDSAPGPDGFHASFFQRNWNIVQHDVCRMVNHFWTNERMLCSLNKTVIILIPKHDRPQGVFDFKPISLCNTACKIISEVLYNLA